MLHPLQPRFEQFIIQKCKTHQLPVFFVTYEKKNYFILFQSKQDIYKKIFRDKQMSAKIGHVEAWCYQITHRATAGQDRYNSRWGTEQYYWNDITHPIHLYTGMLKSLIYELNKELKTAKAEVAYQKQKKEQISEATAIKVMAAEQKITAQKNQQKQYIRDQVAELTQDKNYLYNKYREYERLFQNKCQQFQRVKNQLTAIQNKSNAPETAYALSNNAGQFSQSQKQFILDTVNAKKGKQPGEIQKKIINKFGGDWGVTTGLIIGQWSCQASWQKWLICSSNKKSVFIWKQKQKIIPKQTEYSVTNSYGLGSEQQKATIKQVVSNVMANQSASNRCRVARQQLNEKLGGEWGMVFGLAQGWGGYYWWDSWAVCATNLSTVFVWKRSNVVQNEKKQTVVQQPQESEKLQEKNNLEVATHQQKKQEPQKQTQLQTHHQQSEPSIQNKNQDELDQKKFILIQNGGAQNYHEQVFIRVLLDELMLPTENPFTRAEWVSQLAQQNYGDQWGSIVNVSLFDWAKKEDYKKWYLYQLGDMQVLLWSKEGTVEKKVMQEEHGEEIKELPEITGKLYAGQTGKTEEETTN